MKYKRRFFLCTGQVVAAEDAWRFPGSHILGDLRDMSLPSCSDGPAARTAEEGRVPSLALWLMPVDCLRVPPLHPEIVAYILGEGALDPLPVRGMRENAEMGGRILDKGFEIGR